MEDLLRAVYLYIIKTGRASHPGGEFICLSLESEPVLWLGFDQQNLGKVKLGNFCHLGDLAVATFTF